MSAQNNGSGASDFVSGLQDAVRQNPVSAALVGMGLLWMFTGGNRLSTAAFHGVCLLTRTEATPASKWRLPRSAPTSATHK